MRSRILPLAVTAEAKVTKWEGPPPTAKAAPKHGFDGVIIGSSCTQAGAGSAGSSRMGADAFNTRRAT